MKRIAFGILGAALLAAQGSCTFDLTAVEPEVRGARFSVLVETTRGGTTQVIVHLDPGTTNEGRVRSLEHPHITVAGAAYQPTHHVPNGILTYEISGIPESEALISIVPPPIQGLGTVPPLMVTTLRVAAPDTLTPVEGVLEIPIVGTDDGMEWDHSSWHALLHLTNTPGQQISLAGTPLASILRVPTLNFPGASVGQVQLSAMTGSYFSSDPDAVVQTAIQRVLRASFAFRIP